VRFLPSRLLSEGTWTHDHPIPFETAKSFGLPVHSDIPAGFQARGSHHESVHSVG
jgi:hypothetical protein